MAKRIAFVDDEEQILRALKRLFFQADYECVFFSRGLHLLDYLEDHKIDILVTDIRMPEMDGIALMQAVKRKQPQAIRIALSGYTDSRQILAALDSGLARLYIYKPWDNDELLSQIDNLMGLVHRLQQPSLMETINGLGSLPTIPEIYQRVTALIEAEASAQEVARVVESDPAIAGKLLRIANTAYYGLHTGSVQQAIVMLGMSNVRQIILTNAVFERADKIPYGKALWHHAALVNQGVAFLHQQTQGKKLPTHDGAAGLMHTLGIIFMATLNTKQYGLMIESLDLNIALGNQQALAPLEREYFGAEHSEISSFLLNWWELPFDIVEAAYYYRHPQEDVIVNKDLVAMVHLVSHLTFGLLEMHQFQFTLNEAYCQRNGNLLDAVEPLNTYLKAQLKEMGV